MADRKHLRRMMEQLATATRAELEALARNFQTDMKALIRGGGDPAATRSKIDALVAAYEKAVGACENHLQAELDRLFPFRPKVTRGPFEEPRRRSGPPPHRRPLPKWPPDKRPSAGGVTVEPNRPNNLSGGAAAPLDFDSPDGRRP